MHRRTPTPTSMRTILTLALSLSIAAPQGVLAAPAAAPEQANGRAPEAEAAYAAGLALVAERKYAEAVTQLDLAAELEPTWADPVRARAEVFATLADRYRPSEFFMSSRMADLQRLLALEPGVDEAGRRAEIAALQQDARKAEKTEARRRKLTTPALIMITVSAGLLISGAMLYGMKPNDFLKPTALNYQRRDMVGLGMLIAGIATAPPAIALGVLAGRQARRDSAVRDFQVETGRPRASLGLTPSFLPGGGGMSLTMRF